MAQARMNARRRTTRWATSGLMVVASVIFAFPFVWMVLVSLRRRVDVLQPDKLLAPLTFESYRTIFQDNGITSYFVNSLVVAVVNTAVSLVIGTVAAYGFARFSWRQREDRAFWILSQRFLPAMAVVIPFFLMATLVNIVDTQIVLIIAYTLFNVPFTIWMMRGFIEDIPVELEEAAFVDGATRARSLRSVVLPLIAPGLAATGIFCLMASWNEFAFANFLTVINAKTLPTSVMMYLSVSGVKWGEMAATGVVATLPVLAFAISVQKYMIRGLTFGSVK